METENNSKNKVGIIIGVIVVFGVLGVSVVLGRKATPTTPPSAPLLNPPIDVPKNSVSMYKDGTYSATGQYMSPGGLDKIAITLTLSNDIVTDVSATPEPGDNTSARYQDKFISSYKDYVVGRNIADINLTKVSGSSLTPKGFNDALAQIKAQAKA